MGLLLVPLFQGVSNRLAFLQREHLHVGSSFPVWVVEYVANTTPVLPRMTLTRLMSEQRCGVMHRETLHIGRFRAKIRKHIATISAPRARLSRTKGTHIRHNPPGFHPSSLGYVLIRTMKSFHPRLSTIYI